MKESIWLKGRSFRDKTPPTYYLTPTLLVVSREEVESLKTLWSSNNVIIDFIQLSLTIFILIIIISIIITTLYCKHYLKQLIRNNS